MKNTVAVVHPAIHRTSPTKRDARKGPRGKIVSFSFICECNILPSTEYGVQKVGYFRRRSNTHNKETQCNGGRDMEEGEPKNREEMCKKWQPFCPCLLSFPAAHGFAQTWSPALFGTRGEVFAHSLGGFRTLESANSQILTGTSLQSI